MKIQSKYKIVTYISSVKYNIEEKIKSKSKFICADSHLCILQFSTFMDLGFVKCDPFAKT